MQESSPQASAQRSWRQKSPSVPVSSGGKWFRRIGLSLLGLGLLGLLLGLFYWLIAWPKTYFASLPVIHYDLLAVSPIPYLQEDSEAFVENTPPQRSTILGDLELSANIARLSNHLHGLGLRHQDILILSLSVHGVSEDGKAYFLCSDFVPNTPSSESGRYPLHDFLELLRDCPAQTKLVLLDANHLLYDPRLGMMVNEFPRLLEEELKDLDDPTIWVISSADSLQLAQYSTTTRRSFFSEILSEAFQGSADRNRNHSLEMEELFSFLREELPKRSSQHTQIAQTPLFLRGKQGISDPPPNLILTPILNQTSSPKSATSPTKDSSSADTKSSSPAGSNQEKTFTESRALFKKLLEQGWNLRDTLQDRQQKENAGWSPIDYAPHLWKEYQEVLLGYERRFESGTAFDPKKLASDLKTELDAWTESQAASASLTGSERQLVLGRLASARNEFMQSAARRRLDRDDPTTVSFKKYYQRKNDFLLFATFYVRWHGAVAFQSDRPLAFYQPLELFLEKLATYCDDVEHRRTTLVEKTETAGSPSLESGCEELTRLQNELETRYLLPEAQFLIDAWQKNTPAAQASARRGALLSIPLLPSSVRMNLLETLEKKGFSSGLNQFSEELAKKSFKREDRWQRLAEQARLERHLIRIFDPLSAIALPDNISPDVDFETGDRSWLTYRKFGKQLKEFYEGIPTRINAELEKSEDRPQATIERLLRTVDARDVKRVSTKIGPSVVPMLPEPPLLAPELICEKNLALPREDWLTFEVTVKNRSMTSHAASLRFKYEAARIEIRLQENREPMLSGKSMPLAFEEKPTITIPFQVRLKPGQFFDREKLELEATLEDQIARAVLEFQLAPIDAVDLMVMEFGRPVEKSTTKLDRIRLRPYPNRTTSYQLAIVNRSGPARKVIVDLFALPSLKSEDRSEMVSPFDRSGNPREGFKRIAESVELDLPSKNTPVPLRFPEPKKAESTSEKTTSPEKADSNARPEEKTGNLASKEKSKPSLLLPNGIVCAVRDAKTKQVRELRRIDFIPRVPHDYLQSAVGYDAERGKITLRLTPGDSQNLPPISPENPISILWSNVGELPADVTVKDRATITEADQSATLFADVESAPDKKIWIRLTVDGYPRAFVFLVPCNRNRENIARERSLEEIRIVAPSSNQAYRVPLENPIPLEFQVDAPEDSFRNPFDSIKVMIVGETNERELCPEEHREIFSDRQVEIVLKEVTSSGDFNIEAKVGDFKIPLGVGGLKNTRARIMTQLQLSNPNAPEDRIARKAFAPILLQGSPPTLGELLVSSMPIPQGKPVPVSITLEKVLSDIKEVQIGIDRDNSGSLEDGDKPEKLRQPSTDGNWKASLPTDDLKPGRYLVIAKATDVLGFTAKTSRPLRIVTSPSREVPQATTTSSISGRVLLEDGRPLPRIRMTLRGTNFSATSDGNGQFDMKNVPHGTYKLEARGTALGREIFGIQEVVLPGESDPVSVEMRLEW